MSNNKQSSVDWLIKQIKNDHNEKCLTGLEWMKIFEQAKEMHKQEVMQTLNDGKFMVVVPKENKSLEQYYNETFG